MTTRRAVAWRSPRIPEALAKELASHAFICGVDEVGLGSWAGPLVVCAAIVPRDWKQAGVTDSKKLSPASREAAARAHAPYVTHCIVETSPYEIDQMGVAEAWKVTCERAIHGALIKHAAGNHVRAPLVIIDGQRSVLGAAALPKADLLVPAVSIASIIAKVYRDRLMRDLAKSNPGYGWETNVGYGTPVHHQGLLTHGLTDHHRTSYSPMREMRSGA